MLFFRRCLHRWKANIRTYRVIKNFEQPLYFAMLVLLCSCSASSSDVQREQPIQYNHNLHVQEQEMDCLECHPYAATHARATIPNIEICGECHSDEPMSDSPEEVKLIEYVDGGKRIPWRKVYHLEDHIYFSHRRHTTLAEIECVVCHGDTEAMTAPYVRPVVPVTMDRCMECHEESGVTADCVSCHR